MHHARVSTILGAGTIAVSALSLAASYGYGQLQYAVVAAIVVLAIMTMVTADFT